MPIVPAGTTNIAALNVPNVYVQLVPPNPLLNGIPTNILAVVGTAPWGPKNSPVVVSLSTLVQNFGTPQPVQYDLGTVVYAASLQGATFFKCVRVTDGTDTAASGNLVDAQSLPNAGAILTGFYTGSVGNTISAQISQGSSYTTAVPTYKLTVYINGGIPEVFDNIGGNGITFWENLVAAVNFGSSVARGPSQLVIASLGTGISAASVTFGGSYSAIPTVNASVGTGATFSVEMQALSTTTLVSAGSGYAANDTITLTGGTFSTATVITVLTVSTGAISTFSVSTPGLYTALPSNPVAQGTTSGSGTGATFDVLWGVSRVIPTAHGAGYTSATALTFSTGAATATAVIGSTSAPSLTTTTTLTGGTDGTTTITSATLIGNDATSPRTGMYALRNSQMSVLVLADATDPTKWTLQNAFGLSESCYVIGTAAAGSQDDAASVATLLQTAGVDSYAFKLMFGDWCQIDDPFNNLVRFISPQSFSAGVLVNQLPSNSSLNKALTGVVATQKSLEQRSYSDADLSFLRTSRIEVITNPIPAGNVFGSRLGINTSSNALTQTDNYPRMVNFLGQTILSGLGIFIGQPQTPDVRSQAKAVIQGFLQNLFQLNMIGDVNKPGDASAAFTVILDATNNPPNRVALGYMQADVQVVLYSIVQYLVVNLNAQQGSLVQVLPPQASGV